MGATFPSDFCGCMGCLPFLAGILVAYFLVEIIFWGW